MSDTHYIYGLGEVSIAKVVNAFGRLPFVTSEMLKVINNLTDDLQPIDNTFTGGNLLISKKCLKVKVGGRSVTVDADDYVSYVVRLLNDKPVVDTNNLFELDDHIYEIKSSASAFVKVKRCLVYGNVGNILMYEDDKIPIKDIPYGVVKAFDLA